ncbi:MAG: acyl carrier protein [Chloroflexota bacterium]|nr:acyl carrier protein [Chloroflexota bacterium]
MSPSVYSRLKKVIVDQLGVDEDEVVPDASFAEDLNAGQDEVLDLVTALEEEFGIEFSLGEATRLFIRNESTVKDALEYLEEKLE